MPKIPATRKLLLKRPDQDKIQWTLTNHNEKRKHYKGSIESPTSTLITTVDIAKKFIKLVYNTNDKQVKIDEIVKDIKHLYNNMNFSTKVFIEYVLEHVSSIASLLVIYYEVSVQLDVLALSTRSLLAHIPHFDEPLCEIFYYQDKVGEAYIQALDETTLYNIFAIDGKQFLNWSGLMKAENVQRLLCILKHYSKTMKKEQCLNLLLQLQTAKTENVNKYNLKQIKRVKEFIFTPNKMSTKQSNTLIIKSPVLQFLSTWFFEFEPNSMLKLTEFALNLILMNSESNEKVPDISLLLYMYNMGCKQLVLRGRDIIRVSDIIEILNEASIKSLEQGNSGALGLILTFGQLAFENMHESVGYTYASWFQATFIHANTCILNKKSSILFINMLQQLIPYELPSILQIHGKAVYGCPTIPTADIYVLTVKKRLLELGEDSTFRKYPQSIRTPVQSTTVVLEDDISDILRQFVKRGEVVPHSLLSASVFRRTWFVSTFLPKLLSWEEKSEIQARDKLIESLRKDKKIPDAMYQDFIQRKKK